MWILPFLVISAIVVAAASKSPREVSRLARQLPSPPSGPPGPISTLGEILRVGQVPPPTVILSAIAEAEARGQTGLVSDIVRVFVAPVVYQHQGRAVQEGRLSSGVSAYSRGVCSEKRSSRAAAERNLGPPIVPIPLAGPPQEAFRQPSEEEILAMLHSDPKAFLAMVSSRRQPTVEAPIAATPSGAFSAMSPSGPALSMRPDPAIALPPQESQPSEASPEAFSQLLVPGSPLGGVHDDAWREFVFRLEREDPSFSSSRHVGQYRQRRERLLMLGIDPQGLQGSVTAQRAALDMDLAEAHHHAAAGGLFEHLGRLIAVPGQSGSEAITLSGMLGVIQCAGLEGAVSWLENPNDRKRYPHTTRVFASTNGIF